MKKHALGTLVLCASAAFLLAGCGGGGGGAAGGGAPTGNPSAVTAVQASVPQDICPNGGATVQSGIDDNRNGLLDTAEVDSTQYLCNGSNGAVGPGGIATLVSISTESSGANCPAGGVMVSAGPDTNGSGVLDPAEVTSSHYVCNGAQGPNGPATVVIQSLTANPPVVRPGESTTLMVVANDGAGSPLTYQWSGAGSFAPASAATTTWTAPAAVGSYLLSAAVSNGTSTVTGYAAVLVSVSPTGPIITNVSPAKARAGEEVRITGAGFGAARNGASVTIGGVAAPDVVSWSDWEVHVTVPAGAATGAVIVTTGGAQSSPGYLVVPWGNPVISAAADHQVYPHIIPDGSGGAIMVWEDYRDGDGDSDIYAQRVNGDGTALWAANGVAVSTATGPKYHPQPAADGSGGVIITWEDRRSGTSYDIYAQRVNAAGIVQWTANGVAISTAPADQLAPQIVTDGSGGAIIAWGDNRNGVDSDIYAQRVNAAGAVQWTANGVAVCAASDLQDSPQLVADSGGVVITWRDRRSGNDDIYAQRVNSAGAAQWTANGVAICTASDYQDSPQIVAAGNGGAIITWEDHRSGMNYDVYAQRVSGAGAVQWTADGVAVSTAANEQVYPQIAADGSNGAIITWQDYRSGTDWDIYAQRVNSAGAVQWAANGVVISAATKQQELPRIAADGSGGAIITWQDYRNGYFDMNNFEWRGGDIYAQRVNSAGVAQWTADGLAICTENSEQRFPWIVADGSGGAIIVWDDNRNGNYDIYALGAPAEGL